MEVALKEMCQKFGPKVTFKPGQLESLHHIWDWGEGKKRDVLVSLPCGYGKSIIYQVLPDLLAQKHSCSPNHSVVLVFCPLNLIIQDQLLRMRDIGVSACRLDVQGKAFALCSGEGLEETAVKLAAVSAGLYSLIYLHPESIFKSEQGQALLQDDAFRERVTAVVVDECHKVEDWRKNFRKAFGRLDSLVAFFPNVPLIAMSGTLSTSQLKSLPRFLCMRGPVAVVKANPDRPNIFLDKRERKAEEPLNGFEVIYVPECDKLYELRDAYPVTLIFLPLAHISGAMAYVMSKFGHGDINIYDPTVLYCPVYSRLDEETLAVVTSELKKPRNQHCRVRLIFCTPAIGMGFDSCHITNVIHSKPTYLTADYFQQISRAGRSGQQSTATLWYTERDLKPEEMGSHMKAYARSQAECLRTILLSAFGFSRGNLAPDACCSVCKSKAIDDLSTQTANIVLTPSSD